MKTDDSFFFSFVLRTMPKTSTKNTISINYVMFGSRGDIGNDLMTVGD